MSEFLRLCPPFHAYDGVGEGPTTAKFSVARSPLSVVVWDGFIMDVGQRHWDPTPHCSPPTFKEFQNMTCEEDVREVFDHNVLSPLNTVLGQEIFHHHSYFDRVEGQPDFAQGVSKQELRLFIEVKTAWSLSEGDLVTAWAQDLANHPDDTTS